MLKILLIMICYRNLRAFFCCITCLYHSYYHNISADNMAVLQNRPQTAVVYPLSVSYLYVAPLQNSLR